MLIKKVYVAVIFAAVTTVLFILFSQINRIELLFLNNLIITIFVVLSLFVIVNLILNKTGKHNLIDNEKYNYLIDYASFFTNAISVIFLVTSVLITPARVSGDSMEPNLHNNDIAIVSPVLYSIDRFDVVIVRIEVDGIETLIVKRVIGLPGDELKYEDGKLYINGVYMEEDFDTSGFTGNYPNDLEVPYVIPNGSYFLVGDNRNNSTDSRILGYIERGNIVGKLLFTI